MFAAIILVVNEVVVFFVVRTYNLYQIARVYHLANYKLCCAGTKCIYIYMYLSNHNIFIL